MQCFEDTLSYISPAHGGWGIIRVAALVPDSHLLFVCPSACFRHGALGAIWHGYKNKISYLYIQKTDIVNGYDEVMQEGIEELLERLKKKIKVLFVFVSCLDDFIGTDLETVMKLMEKKYPDIFFKGCHMNPIASDTKKPPLVTTLDEMLSTIRKPEKLKKQEKQINLFGNFVSIPEKAELMELLQHAGMKKVMQLSECQSFEEYQQMGESMYSMILTPAITEAVQNLAKRTEMNVLFLPVSYDCREIRASYEKLADFLGIEADSNLDSWEADAQEQIDTAREKLKELPIIVSESAVLRPFALAFALLEYGFCVESVMAQEVIAIDRHFYEKLIEKYPQVHIFQPQHSDWSERRREEKKALAIGQEGAYLLNCSYAVDLSGDEGMYGYYGVCELMHRMTEAIKEKADLYKMITEYGGIV